MPGVPSQSVSEAVVLDCADFPKLLASLDARGYTVVGPTIRDGAIVYGELGSEADLPIGWTEVQEAGTYGLRRRSDEARFGFAVGPHSWKQFLFPPRTRLWRANREDGVFRILQEDPETPRYALIGVRSCELHAIAIQDRVFLEGEHVDPTYHARRSGIFTVAVNCGQAGGTCFCVSMDTGPKAEIGYDLALTELMEEGRHQFLVEIGSARGAEVVSELPTRPAGAADCSAAEAVVQRTASQMGRTLDTTGIKELLYENYEHPRWDDVATRCLSCANCTLVCPTCFCSDVQDTSEITGDHAERWRSWDSCFTMDHSYLHGGSVRASTKSRYRQWMTHKLATWIDQFGSSGCVGCGRCVTWCPVGIDITEEARAIRESDARTASSGED